MPPWCNVCGAKGPFLASGEGREGSVCRNCTASGRTRALVLALGRALGYGSLALPDWPVDKTVRVLEVAGRGAYPLLLGEKLQYVNAQYQPNLGARHHPGGSVADLERLAYGDGDLDTVLAADVFEHVRDDERAFREVGRALKPGGLLIFTVPVDYGLSDTLVRVEVVDGVEQLLEPPEYHGGGGASLAYRTYGRDLPARLRTLGFSVGRWSVDTPALGIWGQDVFVAAKGPCIELGNLAPGDVQPPDRSLPALLPFRAWNLLKYNLRAMREVGAHLAAKLDR